MQANQSGWLGGLSYMRNLLTAICACDDRRIEPVLLVHPALFALEQSSLNGFPAIEVIRAPWVAPRHPARLASRALYGLLDRDLTLELLLRKHGVDALSHSTVTGTRSTVASIGWIPDFQHVRMPQYFTPAELRERDRQFMRLIRGSHRIVLSSEDAQRDFAAFAPEATGKTQVLHFISCPDDLGSALPPEQLCARFNIDRPYFHLPNQFWTHKNHAVVIEALGLLKQRGIQLLVLATGNTADHRDPLHFERLIARAKALGVEDNFRVLGIVSRPELQSLMLHAVAMINPSNFEGWSTTVEESKSLGLPIVLSDIPVHIEQAPPLGRYFKADSAEDLADALVAAVQSHDPTLARLSRDAAAAAVPERIRAFGQAYDAVVMAAIEDISH
jgi:glycosyltransferase involved in cell wall biosynthesis